MKYYIGQVINSNEIFAKALKDFANIDVANIEIVCNRNGKPFIKNTNIYFSKSHSNNYVIYAFSKKPIGVDMEYLKDININLPNAFFNEIEKEYIKKDKLKLFEIWTLKEAVLKMNGKALKDINKINNDYKKYIIDELNDYFITIVEQI